MAELRIVRTVADVRALVASWRAAGESVALVPTMGNLHEGHLSLARLAAGAAARVVTTIYVNPTQFGPGEDFAAYPRTLDEDRERLIALGVVDALFVPESTEIYPFGIDDAVRVTLPALAHELCGAHRPGHLDGVASVVCRLLNIATPDILVLGEKDYQQLVLMRRMVEDLRLPVRVLGGETKRERDGLAMSSRNRYLSTEERARAPELHATLVDVCEALRGGARDFAALEARGVERLRAAGFVPDYVEVRRAEDLARPGGAGDEQLIVLAAARLGKARLIDNVRV